MQGEGPGWWIIVALFMMVASTRADLVTEWNQRVLEAVKVESTSAPQVASRLAILHGAVFEAINAIDRTHQPLYAHLEAPADASREAAALSAAYDVAVQLYPSRKAVFIAAANADLSRIATGLARDAGVRVGKKAAAQILAWRSTDGANTALPYIPHTEAGQWRRTPPYFRPPELPHWRAVRPFVLTNASQFLPPGPPPIDSARFAADFNEVKSLGRINSSTRTADQTEIALYWANGPGTITPPGHWNQIAALIARQKNYTLAQNARLFALLNIAMADAGVATWEAKYQYHFWRPVTAIARATEDDNPATEPESDWTSLVLNPPFPEYVSGHSAFSSAAAAMLADFFGDDIDFTAGSDGLPGVQRSFTSFSAAAGESGISRIYGGIHYSFSNRDGLKLGRDVAHFVLAHCLKPTKNP